MALAEQYIRQAADVLRRAMQARSAELDQLNNDIESMRQEIHDRQTRMRDEVANKKRTIGLFEGEIQNAKRGLEKTIRREDDAVKQLDSQMLKLQTSIRNITINDNSEQQDQLRQSNGELVRLQQMSMEHQRAKERAAQEFGVYEAVRLQRITQFAGEIDHLEQETETIVRDLQHRIDQKRRPLNDMDHQVRDLERKALEVEQAAGAIPNTVFG